MGTWDLYNEAAVNRLKNDDPDILPEYSVDSSKDTAYNKKQINSCITSSIIRGSSVQTIADDLSSRMSDMNYTSAVKTARTGITNAQNSGRLDSYYAAKEMGINVRKEWVSCLDGRVRESHEALDKKVVDLDDEFGYGLKYPGDSSAPPEQVYNCRCSMVANLPDDQGKDDEAKRRSYNFVTKERRAAIVEDISFTKWCGRILRPYFSEIDNQVAANGMKISRMSDHALTRTHDRNVTQEGIIDAIKTPNEIGNIKYDRQKRPSRDFIGEDVTAAVNPETGEIASVWHTGSRHKKRHKKK